MEAYWKRQVPKSCGCLRFRGDLEYFVRKYVIAVCVAESPSSGMGGGGGGGSATIRNFGQSDNNRSRNAKSAVEAPMS